MPNAIIVVGVAILLGVPICTMNVTERWKTRLWSMELLAHTALIMLGSDVLAIGASYTLSVWSQSVRSRAGKLVEPSRG